MAQLVREILFLLIPLPLIFPRVYPFIYSAVQGLELALSRVGRLTARRLAPLRRVVVRELVSFQPDARVRRLLYSLRDQMECGHSVTHPLLDGLRDLLNAYTENPLIRARRHRCVECASLLAERKPIQSALVIGKAAGAA